MNNRGGEEGLPAVFMAGWRNVLGESGCCEEKGTPLMIRDAGEALHLLPQGMVSTFRINGTFIELLRYLRASRFKKLVGNISYKFIS